jgi:glucokinase
MLLAGDIGGTKTDLGIYSRERGPRNPLAEGSFPSRGYEGLSDLVGEFLLGSGLVVERAALGVAGPVVGGRATTTNLPWVLDEGGLARDLNLASVRLLNDLEAIAYGVPLLRAADVKTLNTGRPDSDGALAVIAPGTGLGEAFVTREGGRFMAHASEGGHVDFAPATPLEIDMLRYFLERSRHVSYEYVCSGKGIPRIYAYLKAHDSLEEPGWLSDTLATVDDPTPVIVDAALDDKHVCELCRLTLSVFVSVLAAEAGNLALKVMATGGVYIGGGIPPRIVSLLEHRSFVERFRGKGRLTNLLADMPVHVILNPKTALMGAAFAGLEMERD